MAYNLEPLVQIIDQILHPHHHHHHSLWVLDPSKKKQIETLLKKARFLKDLSKNSSSAVTSSSNVNAKQSLEGRIRDAAYDAEDILESHQILSCSEGDQSFIFSPTPDLDKVIAELDSIKEEMMTIMKSSHVADSSSSPAAVSISSSSRQDPNQKNIIVGVAADLFQLKDRLTRQSSKALEVIPIVGMGGIGKTTLAQKLYDDPSVKSHFDTRAWATISQDYNKRKLQDVLLSLLGCVIGKPNIDEMVGMSNDQLSLRLYQALKGRRYLIVLDDMWDIKPWDDTTRFFPDENNGSRIVVTTRESEVADYTGSGSSHHQMNLLKDDESWNLLRQKVFAPDETCSPELEKIGKKIAKDCRGLPLAVHVIGGILSQAKTSQEFWEQVSDNVSSTVADEGEQYSNILSLSYNRLPNHLKPCFLYMGAFPEDYEIRSSKLIKLLVAEGLVQPTSDESLVAEGSVQPTSDESLEEVAEMHLKSLVDRNLIFVRQQGTNGNVKSYGIHDLLRDLCARKASEEKFLFVHGWAPGNLPINTSFLRRVCAHGPFRDEDANRLTEQIRLARSFLVFNDIRGSTSFGIFQLRLLRVLDMMQELLYELPEAILQLVNLRYLAINLRNTLPSSISRLCNLQTLIARHAGLYRNVKHPVVVHALLDMTQLRHIQFKGPRNYVGYHGKDKNRFVVLHKLQTVSPIGISELTDRVIEALPNLEKLGIFWDKEVDHARDLSPLHKLHKLECSYSPLVHQRLFLSLLVFPPSLKQLTLRACRILDQNMNEISKLPNLEVLKLRECFFESLKWEADEGEFCQLQFLLMEKLNLVNWAADDACFPGLEHLVIRRCEELKEIPLAIGEIPTLKIIEVHEDNPSLVANSAREIQKEQIELGNYDLQVRITSW